MKRLIINADDLGVNPQRSHGIFQCLEFGIVTSATIVANGTDSTAAARHARERKVTAGLHLNLTEDYPLSSRDDVASLIEMNGRFFERHRLRELLDAGQVRPEHVEREVRAQVEWMFDAYGTPTHVDGHHHIHCHPIVAHALIPLLERYGIRFVRIPCEDPLPPFGFEVPEEQVERARRMSAQAREARAIYAAAGIGSTDHFRGLALVGNASAKNLRHIITRLPEGSTELMVHPGSQTAYGTPFDLDPQRQTELRMLLDEGMREVLAERKVELGTFADLE